MANLNSTLTGVEGRVVETEAGILELDARVGQIEVSGQDK